MKNRRTHNFHPGSLALTSLTVLAAGLVCGACSEGTAPQLGVSEFEITGQNPGGSPPHQYFGRWSNVTADGPGYLGIGLSGGTADHVFWSYATVRTNLDSTCSGTFIGPNILLTAAHCGHVGFLGKPPKSFTALLYSEGSESADQAVISSQCDTLVQQIATGDTHLLYCQDVNWDNTIIPPGELLGMADLDQAPLLINDAVWSSWVNADCPNPPNATTCGPGATAQLIFSPGAVNGTLSVRGAPGVTTTQIMAIGGSGSSMWRESGAWPRLVSSGLSFAPMGVAACGTGTAGCPGNAAASIAGALTTSSANPSDPRTFNPGLLQGLGLAGAGTPWPISDYRGLMDSDQNGFFDVVERLDYLNGIRSGDTVWLGFESPRRNRMWTVGVSAQVTFYDNLLFAHIDYAGNGTEPILTMPRVFLSPGETYRFSIMSYTNSSAAASALAVELWNANGLVSTVDIPTPVNGQWEMEAGELTTGTGAVHAVKVRATASQYDGSIAAFTLVRQASANRFDSHSERLTWRNDATGGRAWIVPYGNSNVSGEIDWAAVVTDSTSNPVDWSLRNRQLAIDPTREYRVCFDVRSFPENSGSGVGRVALGDGASGSPSGGTGSQNQIYLDEDFPITDTWTNVCTSGTFQAAAGDNLLKFAHLDGEPQYLIDDVVISE